MKELTKAEEQIMQILWGLEKGFVNDIIDKMPKPKPAYNTVSTIIRILEKKGFVDHRAYGKTFPLILKNEYTKGYLKGFIKNYFSDSYKNLISFFSKNEKLSVSELEDIVNMLQTLIENKKREGE